MSMNESGHTYERVTSHICTSHVSHIVSSGDNGVYSCVCVYACVCVCACVCVETGGGEGGRRGNSAKVCRPCALLRANFSTVSSLLNVRFVQQQHIYIIKATFENMYLRAGVIGGAKLSAGSALAVRAPPPPPPPPLPPPPPPPPPSPRPPSPSPLPPCVTTTRDSVYLVRAPERSADFGSTACVCRFAAAEVGLVDIRKFS